MTEDYIIIPISPYPNPQNEQEIKHNKFVAETYDNEKYRIRDGGAFHITVCDNRCHVWMSQAHWINGSFQRISRCYPVEQFHSLMAGLADFWAELPIKYTPTETNIDEILDKYKDWS